MEAQEFNSDLKIICHPISVFPLNENFFFFEAMSIITLTYLKTIHLRDNQYEPIGKEVYIKKRVAYQIIEGTKYHCTYKIPTKLEYNIWAWTYHLDEMQFAKNRIKDIDAQYKLFTRFNDFNYIPGAGIRDHVRLIPGR
jgi:hypothetical protein